MEGKRKGGRLEVSIFQPGIFSIKAITSIVLSLRLQLCHTYITMLVGMLSVTAKKSLPSDVVGDLMQVCVATHFFT